LGAQNAVAGGGRYDGLVKALGGPDLPATGFAIGFDRLTEIVGLDTRDYLAAPDIFIAALGEKCILKAFEWSCALGREGIRIDMDFSDKSLKSQMKRADRSGARHVLIVGEKELEQQAVIIRDMNTSEQQRIPIGDITEKIKTLIKRKQNGELS